LPVKIREVDESLFDDEIHLCVPPKGSAQYASFEKGIEDKRKWLRRRLDELGSVAQIAYHQHEPVAFVEYALASKAPVPFAEDGKTALITCINKPKFKQKGVGTRLLEAAVGRLRELGIEQVKVVVVRNPHWTTGGVFLKDGFQLEKTFYKPGGSEPLDLLSLGLKAGQRFVGGPSVVRFEAPVGGALPVYVACFSSGQCPFNAVIYDRVLKALGKFDRNEVVFERLDSWENCRLARECCALYSDVFVNGRAPFLGPVSEEKIEEEIRKEIEKARRLA